MGKLILSEQDKHLLKTFRIYEDKHSGYYRIYVKGGKYIYLHRYLMEANVGDVVDHINRNKSDNRRENLRIVSQSLNIYNQDIKNKLGRGIYFDKYGNRYRACISNKNKTLKLGSFKNTSGEAPNPVLYNQTTRVSLFPP